MVSVTKIDQLRNVLMEPKSKKVIKEPYFTIRSNLNKETLTVLDAGTNGFEFNKTIGFFHLFPGVLIYRCLYGQGILIIQKSDESEEAKEVKVVGLRPGTEIEVPSGYGHTIINTGKNFLVMADNTPENGKFIDVEPLKKKHGLAYYVVDKKGDISFERNPNYNFHPQITTY